VYGILGVRSGFLVIKIGLIRNVNAMKEGGGRRGFGNAGEIGYPCQNTMTPTVMLVSGGDTAGRSVVRKIKSRNEWECFRSLVLCWHF
jgi:hypothetical protein